MKVGVLVLTAFLGVENLPDTITFPGRPLRSRAGHVYFCVDHFVTLQEYPFIDPSFCLFPFVFCGPSCSSCVFWFLQWVDR